ncbi:hypothetical protein KC330_g7553 [Hortaea werneckii]|nr:hypothetical protein KC330_g7553 [Hortaea werneckii]
MSDAPKRADRLVTIHVGPEQVEFEVQEEAFCRSSAFAKSKIEANRSSGLRLFKTQAAYAVKLEEVSPDVFSIYHKFLIDDTFDLSDIANNGPLSKLVELFSLAHTLQDSVFGDMMVKAVAEYVENAVSLSPHPADLPHLAEFFAATAVIPNNASIPATVARILGRLAIVEIKESTQAAIVRYEGWLKELYITIEEKQEQIKLLKQKNKEMQKIQSSQLEYQRRVDQELETKDNMILRVEECLMRTREEAMGLSAKLRSAELAAFNRSALAEFQASGTSVGTQSRIGNSSISRIGSPFVRGTHVRTQFSDAASTAGKRKRSPANDNQLPINKRLPSSGQYATDEAIGIDFISSTRLAYISRLDTSWN